MTLFVGRLAFLLPHPLSLLIFVILVLILSHLIDQDLWYFNIGYIPQRPLFRIVPVNEL